MICLSVWRQWFLLASEAALSVQCFDEIFLGPSINSTIEPPRGLQTQVNLCRTLFNVSTEDIKRIRNPCFIPPQNYSKSISQMCATLFFLQNLLLTFLGTDGCIQNRRAHSGIHRFHLFANRLKIDHKPHFCRLKWEITFCLSRGNIIGSYCKSSLANKIS